MLVTLRPLDALGGGRMVEWCRARGLPFLRPPGSWSISFTESPAGWVPCLVELVATAVHTLYMGWVNTSQHLCAIWIHMKWMADLCRNYTTVPALLVWTAGYWLGFNPFPYHFLNMFHIFPISSITIHFCSWLDPSLSFFIHFHPRSICEAPPPSGVLPQILSWSKGTIWISWLFDWADVSRP